MKQRRWQILEREEPSLTDQLVENMLLFRTSNGVGGVSQLGQRDVVHTVDLAGSSCDRSEAGGEWF